MEENLHILQNKLGNIDELRNLIDSLPKRRNIKFPSAFAEEGMTHIFHLSYRHSKQDVNIFADMEREFQYIGFDVDETISIIIDYAIDDLIAIVNGDTARKAFLIEAIDKMTNKDKLTPLIKLIFIQ